MQEFSESSATREKEGDFRAATRCTSEAVSGVRKGAKEWHLAKGRVTAEGCRVTGIAFWAFRTDAKSPRRRWPSAQSCRHSVLWLLLPLNEGRGNSRSERVALKFERAGEQRILTLYRSS